MAEAIRMPLLSDTMKEGVIAAWHKKVGDFVKSDDVLADVETDKATMEVIPYVEGTLLYIGLKEGEAAKVNDIIAIVGKEGEDFKSLLEDDSKDKAEQDSPPAQKEQSRQEPKEEPKKEKLPGPDKATIIRMPLLSDTMTEGKIITWHKKEGDTVKSDDILADVETDKATMEVMPYVDGTLIYLGVKEGESARVNDIIAIVGKAGTDISGLLEQERAEQNKPTDQPAPEAEENRDAPEKISQATEGHGDQDENGTRIKASPLAKKMAREQGIDLRHVKGTGDQGRIIKRDIDNYRPETVSQASPVTLSSVPLGQESSEEKPLSSMRKVIAQRLSESKFSAPHFYLRISVMMDKAVEARKMLNEVSPVKISFNDLIIKAVATALKKHPEVNSSWAESAIRQNHHIHIGSAVAVDEGLIVPVIRFADQKPLSTIAEESKTLAEKARTKKLQPQEFSGNTFTISNLGMMDIDEFTAIINPPDSCILAVGKITPTPVVENGEIVIRQILKLTMSCDHRVVDGATGARFLQDLKKYLENPVVMLV